MRALDVLFFSLFFSLCFYRQLDASYTGFCPDMPDHIGYNYHKATRKTMKSHPHLKTRLADVHFQQEMGIDPHSNQGDFNYCCSMPTQYMPGYPVSAPQNMWYPCYGDGQTCNAGGYPEQAYPLSCSEWGSPCVSKHCNEMYAPCLERNAYACHNQMMMPNDRTYSQNIQQMHYPEPKPCCNSCARGGKCSGDSGNEPSDLKYAGKRYDIRSQVRIDPHRKGGVIPNYMGHIPGMQNSFGEPYGAAASRLLRRHFDELSRKGL